MADARHSQQTVAQGIHITHAFEYANAAARTGATGLTSADIGKIARQLDGDSFWILKDDSPLTWSAIDSTSMLTSTAPVNVTKAAAAVGTSGEAARQDHKHDITTAIAAAQVPGDSAIEGSASSLARSDHKHSLPAYGTGSGTFCQGNDSRLSDARTPTSHATSHQSGGGDAVKLDDLAAPDDNTDLDATTSSHGLLLKLGGGTTNYLRADGTWAAPPGAGSDPTITEATATTSTTTTSTTDVLMNSMTLTPASGTYLVWFSGSVKNSNATSTGEMSIYVGGTRATESARRTGFYRSADVHPFCSIAKVTVNGSEAIEGRWQQLGGTMTSYERTLHIMKVS